MQRDELVAALSNGLPAELASDLIDALIDIRRDVLTQTTGGGASGKFVETFVQVLQYLHRGSYDKKPDVDKFLREIESTASPVPKGILRGSRTARAEYALRSKRNVVHKGEVDPNLMDLNLMHSESQWIVSELLRTVSGLSMQEAGTLVQMVQAPIGGLVEDFEGKKLVVETMTCREESLVLLHHHYPNRVPLKSLAESMERFNAKTVGNTLRALWSIKVVDGDASKGYRLTSKGFTVAIAVVNKYMTS